MLYLIYDHVAYFKLCDHRSGIGYAQVCQCQETRKEPDLSNLGGWGWGLACLWRSWWFCVCGGSRIMGVKIAYMEGSGM